jgi:hypothetical protein
MTDTCFQLAGLNVSILGWMFPECEDYWDGNWYLARARCEASGATVNVEGPIIRAPELLQFAEQLAVLQSTLRGRACLECLEPNLVVEVTPYGSLGELKITVDLSSDPNDQQHRFNFYFDQTYLTPCILGCKNILAAYPPRGERP